MMVEKETNYIYYFKETEKSAHLYPICGKCQRHSKGSTYQLLVSSTCPPLPEKP